MCTKIEGRDFLRAARVTAGARMAPGEVNPTAAEKAYVAFALPTR
jgi:hypothetical protein